MTFRCFLWPAIVMVAGLFLVSCCHAGDCATSYRSTTYTPTYSYSTYTPTYEYVKPVVKEVKVYKEVVVPVAVFAPVVVPLYTASYVPPAQSTTPASAGTPPSPAVAPASGGESKAILEALQRLNQRMDALERRGSERAPPAPPAPAPGGGITTPATRGVPSVFGTKCSICHQRGKESDGGGFVLMEGDGTPARLDSRGLLALAKTSYSGRMPPKKSSVPSLTDPEVSEIMTWIDSQPK